MNQAAAIPAKYLADSGLADDPFKADVCFVTFSQGEWEGLDFSADCVGSFTGKPRNRDYPHSFATLGSGMAA
ncbi:hypothetical protein SBA4_770011 [Candidatus Sulfopaludibacter sp. SbA4]|nr:hypothetical protein SBA4_770011 [Candidatus Sulfopaludibacter sp. SbA4]